MRVRLMLLFFLLLFSIQAVADIVIGIFPRRPAALTTHMFTPLANYLSKEMKEKCILLVPEDFDSFWQGVKDKKFDLVHYNQYHYIRSHKEFGYRVILANEEFGQRTLSGSLTVHTDSNINQLKDLKGKVILFGGGPMAMASYIAPAAVLKRAGMQANKDYVIKFAKNPPSAVIGLFNKVASAAGSGSVILKTKTVMMMVDSTKLKTLAKSEEFVHLPWAVNRGMSRDKQKHIQSSMVKLRDSAQGLAILKSIRVTDFHKVTDKDFDAVRKLTVYALGERY